jgi:electron transfer flavoprotein beta subunit
MNIFVCVKPVPDPGQYDLVKIDPISKFLIRDGIPTVIGPSDQNALEAALRLKESRGGSVTVISMTPLSNENTIRECLAKGADEAYVISDRAFAGADTYATSLTIVKALRATGTSPDLILAGNESADGATAHVPVQIAEWLGIPHLSNVSAVEADADEHRLIVKKKTEGGHIVYAVRPPAVIAVARNANTPRLTTVTGVIKSKNKPLHSIARKDIEADDSELGSAGSPTESGVLITPDTGRTSERLTGTSADIADSVIGILKKNGVDTRGAR